VQPHPLERERQSLEVREGNDGLARGRHGRCWRVAERPLRKRHGSEPLGSSFEQLFLDLVNQPGSIDVGRIV
jgi:hypothetical protein